MAEKKVSYLDENLTDAEKSGGRLRQPNTDESESSRDAKHPEPPATLNPDRPDEFGDGDRRS